MTKAEEVYEAQGKSALSCEARKRGAVWIFFYFGSWRPAHTIVLMEGGVKREAMAY